MSLIDLISPLDGKVFSQINSASAAETDLVIEKGATSVIAVATHGVLSGKAMDNLETSKLIKLMTSDTIPSTLSKSDNQNIELISCAELIAKSIWSLSQKKSIHEINTI